MIRKRLATYHEKTEPLVAYYEDQGVLRRVDGEREPDEVTEELRGILAAMRARERRRGLSPRPLSCLTCTE